MPQLNKTLGNEGGGKLVPKTAPCIYQPLFKDSMNIVMPFNRQLLPDPISYFENRGLSLKGPNSA